MAYFGLWGPKDQRAKSSKIFVSGYAYIYIYSVTETWQNKWTRNTNLRKPADRLGWNQIRWFMRTKWELGRVGGGRHNFLVSSWCKRCKPNLFRHHLHPGHLQKGTDPAEFVYGALGLWLQVTKRGFQKTPAVITEIYRWCSRCSSCDPLGLEGVVANMTGVYRGAGIVYNI